MTIYAGMGRFRATRNAIIEACARAAETYDAFSDDDAPDGALVQERVAVMIRALKEKP